MKDNLLSTAFIEPERWRKAIEHAYGKGIDKGLLKSLCSEETRVTIYKAIRDGKYIISPPHTAQIPKDTPGEFRTVFINKDVDRVILSLLNDLLFEKCSSMIHKSCKSYQKGISCGKIVQEISRKIVETDEDVVGWKSDLSKYFDSVPIRFIDKAFDDAEKIVGKSKLIDVARKYYHQDYYFDENNELQNKYQSLKQGCAVASWLADAVLFQVDAIMSDVAKKFDGLYVRYSDDCMYLGKQNTYALAVFKMKLELMELTLNPKKVEMIDKSHWVKFLGYSIKGKDISLSSGAVKKFQKAIESVTTDKHKISYEQALHGVYRTLYKGYEDFSWATRVLRVINVDHDIDVLNGFVMDAIRASVTGNCHIGGLGYRKEQQNGCIQRGKGKNVKANKEKLPKLNNYLTIRCMQKDLLTNRSLFDLIVRMNM